MITNLLEKTIQIRKPQFEKFILSIFKTSKMERLSLDLDAISFRTRYMIKHGKDLSSLPLLQEEFTKKALELRNVFGITMRVFMDEYVGYGEFNQSDLIDVLAEDVKMDSSYITFTINIISNNIDYLNYVDKILSKEKIFNLYPNEYFRFYSDSYNDGIAKAYPELFEKEKQNIQGEGADQDIFVHSFTFQTSENCSLSCTYCVPGDTKILMSNFKEKEIKDISIGEEVLGFEEFIEPKKQRTLLRSKVTKLFKRTSDDLYKITDKNTGKYLYITGEHPVLTQRGWKLVKDVYKSKLAIHMTPCITDDDNTIDTEDINYITGYFLAAFMGDGSYIQYDAKDGYRRYILRFIVKDQEMNDRMYRYADILGFTFHKYDFRISEKYDLTLPALLSRKKSDYDLIMKLIDDNLSHGNMNTNTNFLVGYLAGIYDAEGSCDTYSIRITNTNMYIMYIIEQALKKLSFRWKYDLLSLTKNRVKTSIRIIGGASENARFFRLTHSAISRKKFERFIGKSIFFRNFNIDVEKIPGNHEVYNIETTTHTYIANSFLVHNCYQINKSPMKMTFDIAKKFVDDLLHDKYDYINQHNSPAIILEFIGGEPLLEIDLTRKIYEYFLEQCYELNHPWFTMHRISICSNGLQYFNPNVQSFFKEYSHNISFNISIDGNKKLHDACRIQPNGEGSYDIDMMALQHYTSHYVPDKNSKMTLAPGNIKYLFESVKSFMENGMKIINLNCVFEPGWTTKHATIEYEQLKELSNYILENDLEDIYISIFNERPESVGDPYNDNPSCFKAGTQVATPNGHKNIEDVKVGDILYTASGSKHRVVRMVKKHSKDNCKIKATGLFETHLTKDHKVFAKKFLYMGWKNTPHYSEPGFYPISELRVHDRIALPLIDFSKGANEKWMTEDLCYLIGVYIADGYTHKERIVITPGYDEDKYYYNLLCRSGLKFTIGESRTSKRYSISRCSSILNKQFYDICQTVGHGAHRKHFSNRILRLSKEYLIKVLYGYLNTDGCEMYDGYQKVNTVSPHLASDLMLILRSIGEYPTCYLNKRAGTMVIEGRTVNVRDRYEVYFRTRNRNNHHRYKYDERLNLYWVRLNSIEDDEEYDVYCPTVVPILPDDPEEHTIIINGALAAINCGGNARMLALRANGEFYPCLRYMPSSVTDDVESLQIGNVSTGPHTRASGSKVLHKLDRMTRRSGMTDLCFECPISSSCGGCLAVGHQIIGTPDRKTTFHCVMKYAEALANWYYFNNLIIKHPNWDIDVRQCKLPKNRVLKIISEDEYEFLKYLEIMAIIVKMEYHNKGGESS